MSNLIFSAYLALEVFKCALPISPNGGGILPLDNGNILVASQSGEFLTVNEKCQIQEKSTLPDLGNLINRNAFNLYSTYDYTEKPPRLLRIAKNNQNEFFVTIDSFDRKKLIKFDLNFCV